MTIRIGEEVSFNDIRDTVVRSMQLLNNGVEKYGGEGFALEPIYVSQTTEAVMRLLTERGVAPVWPSANSPRWPKEDDPGVFDYLWLVVLMLQVAVEQNS